MAALGVPHFQSSFWMLKKKFLREFLILKSPPVHYPGQHIGIFPQVFPYVSSAFLIEVLPKKFFFFKLPLEDCKNVFTGIVNMQRLEL